MLIVSAGWQVGGKRGIETDRCLESGRERLDVEKWKSDWLNERDGAAVHSKLCGCKCLSRLSSPRMRTARCRSRCDVLLALAGSLCLFWLSAALLLCKRRALANVSVATLLIAQNNPWLWGLLTHPHLATCILQKSLKLLHLSQSQQARLEKTTPAQLSHGWKSPLKDTEICLQFFSSSFPSVVDELQPEDDHDISVKIMELRDKLWSWEIKLN